MLSDKQKGLEEVLDQWAATPGVLGTLLVSRDGFCILNRCPILQNPDTFCAMSATLMGAAEAALAELNVASTSRVIVGTPERRVVATGATRELLVVCVCEFSLPIEDVIALSDEFAAKVARVIGP